MTGRLETSAGSLLAALRLVKPVIHSRNTIPILSCVAIVGRKVTATDLDTAIEVDFPGKSRNFRAAVAFRQLFSLLAGLPADAEISLTHTKDAGTVTLRFDGGAYRLFSLPHDDFPSIAVDDGAKRNEWDVAGANMADAFRKVFPAISTEETRYYLNGVSIMRLPATIAPGGEETACVVATDGHRLIIKALPGFEGLDGSPIIQRDAVAAICAIGNPDKFELFENCQRMTWPGVRLTSKLIDGKYPDVTRVIPKNATDAITFNRKGGLAAIRRLSAIGSDRSQGISIRQDAEGLVFARKSDGEAAIERVSSAGGIPFQVGFNGHYLTDLLNLDRSAEEVSLLVNDPASPAMARFDGLIAVLMPLREDMKLSDLPPIDDEDDEPEAKAA